MGELGSGRWCFSGQNPEPLHVEGLHLRLQNMGMAQVVERMPSRRAAQVSVVSPPGQSQVQLML